MRRARERWELHRIPARDQQGRPQQVKQAAARMAAACAYRAHPVRARTTDQSDRAWLDAVLRGVHPQCAVSTPAAHQRLPGALAPTEVSTATAIQESQSLLAAHHPSATEVVRPLGVDGCILVTKMTRAG